ncbi:hypothetical protein [Robbsia andropogonis]|uniref:hypothetical protein n=1 Tax=Robbsia andropogonis TaxID=28092 RepID=UPI000466051A|nr:hypothetical protein [Robbsia andropogonis]
MQFQRAQIPLRLVDGILWGRRRMTDVWVAFTGLRVRGPSCSAITGSAFNVIVTTAGVGEVMS